MNIKKYSKLLFIICLLSCKLWSANSDSAITPEVARLLAQLNSGVMSVNSEEWIRTVQEISELLVKNNAKSKPSSHEADIHTDNINSGAFNKTCHDINKFQAGSYDISQDLRDTYMISEEKTLPVPLAPKPVSMDFEGEGRALSIVDKEKAGHEDINEKLDAIRRKFHFDNTIIDGIKKSKISPHIIENFINILNSQSSYSLARSEFNKFYEANKENIDPGPFATKKQVPTRRNFVKSSKPRVGANKDAPQIITVDDFIAEGTSKGLNEEEIRAFFNILSVGKIVESFGLFKDLSKKRLEEYIRERPDAGSKNLDLEQRFNFNNRKNIDIITAIDTYLASRDIDYINRNFIRTLGEKILDRTDEKQTYLLLDIAQLLAGMYENDLQVQVKEGLKPGRVDAVCIELADLKWPEKYLNLLYQNLKLNESRKMVLLFLSTEQWKQNLRQLSALLEKKNSLSNVESKAKPDLQNLGLKNNFNNCYLNSVLQTISQLYGFAAQIDKDLAANRYSPELQAKKNMHQNLSDFFKGLKGEKSTFDPNTNASDKFRFFLKTNGDAPQDNGDQQDAQETYSAIFNRASEGDDFAEDFQIHIEYTYTLSSDLKSKIESEARKRGVLAPDEELPSLMRKMEVTSLLSLDIEDGDLTDLKTCLTRFFKEEPCKVRFWPKTTGPEINLKKLYGYSILVQRTKQIKKMPKILALHLNRFRNQGAELKKVGNNIAFPLILEPNKYLQAENLWQAYHLRSTIFHGGPFINSGHYWAFVKNLVDSKYSLYNDEKVENISLDDMNAIGNFGTNTQDGVHGTAYMLFYERLVLPELFSHKIT